MAQELTFAQRARLARAGGVPPLHLVELFLGEVACLTIMDHTASGWSFDFAGETFTEDGAGVLFYTFAAGVSRAETAQSIADSINRTVFLDGSAAAAAYGDIVMVVRRPPKECQFSNVTDGLAAAIAPRRLGPSLKFISGPDPWGGYPNTVSLVQPVSRGLHPLKRSEGVGALDITFKDDGVLREFIKRGHHYGRKVTVKYGFPEWNEEDFIPLGGPWTIEDHKPKPGHIVLNCSEPTNKTLEREVSVDTVAINPIALMKYLITQAGGAVDEDSFDETAVEHSIGDDPISHWAVSRTIRYPHYPLVVTGSEPPSYFASPLRGVKLKDALDQLCEMVGGSVRLRSSDGAFVFAREDLSGPAIRHLRESELENFEVLTTTEHLYNRVRAVTPVSDQEDEFTLYEEEDEASIARMQEQDSLFLDGGVGKELTLANPFFGQHGTLIYSIESSDTEMFVHGGVHAGFTGARPAETTAVGETDYPEQRDTDTVDPADNRYAYFLITDGKVREYVRASAVEFYDEQNETTINGISEAYPVYPTDPDLGRGVLMEPALDEPERIVQAVKITIEERGLFETLPIDWEVYLHRPYHGGPETPLTLSPPYTKVYDITKEVACVKRALKRCANGIPSVRFDVGRRHLDLDLGDKLTFDHRRYLRFNKDGANNTVVWEVTHVERTNTKSTLTLSWVRDDQTPTRASRHPDFIPGRRPIRLPGIMVAPAEQLVSHTTHSTRTSDSNGDRLFELNELTGVFIGDPSTNHNLSLEGTGRAGFGLDAGGADARVHVHDGSAGAVTATVNTGLVVENDGDAWISILTPDNASGGIIWGSPGSNVSASIVYNNATDVMTFGRLGVDEIIVNDLGVGIHGTPETRLHVWNATAGSFTPTTNTIVTIENSTHAYLTFATPASATAGVVWGDPGSATQASVLYDHATDRLSISRAGVEHIRVDTTVTILSSLTLSTISIPDETAAAFVIREGANNYLAINTVAPNEEITFGNTGTNPDTTFVGTGTWSKTGGPFSFTGSTIALAPTSTFAITVPAAVVGPSISSTGGTTGLAIGGTYTGSALDITHGAHTGSGTNRHALRVTSGLSTGLTNENIDVQFALNAAKTWSSGSLAFQRSVVISGPTLDGAGGTITLLSATAMISSPTIGTIGTHSGQNVALYLTSSNTAAGGHAADPTLRIDQNGSGGDASIRLTAASNYTLGVDNSESGDPFVISRATTLGTDNFLSANATALTLGNASMSLAWAGTSLAFSGSAGTSGMLLRSAGAGVTPAWATHGLDQAYDSGGLGAGRTITVDNGAVQLNVAASTVGFGVAGSGSTTGINVTGTYTGSAVDITHGAHTGSGANRHALRITSGLSTGLTNENIDVQLALNAAKTWSSGTLSFQRSINIQGPTLNGSSGTINLISTTMAMSSPTIGTITHTGINCVMYLTSSNTAASGHGGDPFLFLDQNGTAGDAAIRFRAGSNYTIGVAGNVASDPFKISRSTVLGTTDVISSLSTSLTFGNATDNNTYVWLGTGTWSVGGGIGSSGQVLTSNGAGAAPTWQAAATVTYPLLASAGTAGAPSYSFSGDTNTGIYSVGADDLGFSTGGTLRVDISTTAVTSTLPLLGPAGSATAPSHSFSGDPNTGVYSVGADDLGFTVGGTLRVDISTTAVTSTLPLFASTGAAATPSISFSGDTNTGFYSAGADAIGVALGGVLSISISTAINSNLPFRMTAGSAAAPAFSFQSDSNTGMYNVGADDLGFATNGTLRVNISTTAVTSTLPMFAPDGAAATPSLSFASDPNTGLYSAGADAIGVAIGGVLAMTLSTAVNSNLPFRMTAGSAAAPAFSFQSDSNTGMYNVGADDLGFATGGTLRLSLDTAAVTSTLPIFAPAGAAATPSISFSGDTNTGLYSAGADSIGVAIGGVLAMTLSTAVNSNLPFRMTAGSAAAPAFSFQSDSNTGMYNVGADDLGFATGGTLRVDISTTEVTTTLPILLPTGSASAPAVTFTGDPNTGIYSAGADAIGVAIGGVLAISISTAINSNLAFRMTAGSASAPAFSFQSDSNTGMYNVGADDLGFATGGTLRVNVSTTAVTSTLPFLAPAGSASAPAYSFSGDPNSGFYSASGDVLGLALNGVVQATFDTTAINSNLRFRMTAGTVSSPAFSFQADSNTGIYNFAADTLAVTCGGTLSQTWEASEITFLPNTTLAGGLKVVVYEETIATSSGTSVLGTSSSIPSGVCIIGASWRILTNVTGSTSINIGTENSVGDSPGGSDLFAVSQTTLTANTVGAGANRGFARYPNGAAGEFYRNALGFLTVGTDRLRVGSVAGTFTGGSIRIRVYYYALDDLTG